MAINIPMLRRSFWRLLGNRSYQELCDQEWIISPACITNTRPALYLPGALEKVTASSAASSLEQEMLRVKGGRTEHAATIARILTDTDVYGGYIYKKAVKLPISIQKENLFLEKQITEYKESAVLACNLNDVRFFGHWITDGIPLLMAASELGAPIRNTDKLTAHQNEYLSMLELKYDPFMGGRVHKLIILEDFGQNNYKRERYQKIRARFHELGPKSTHPGTMILRGTSGGYNVLASGQSRVLINEEEIAAYLQSIGFKIIDSTKLTAKEIVEHTCGARIVIGNEGSQTTHGLYTMANNGTLVNIFPPFHFNNVLKGQTDCMDLHYAFMIGDACEGGFRLSMDTLKKTLDLVDANYP
jgi:hypothetical protein